MNEVICHHPLHYCLKNCSHTHMHARERARTCTHAQPQSHDPPEHSTEDAYSCDILNKLLYQKRHWKRFYSSSPSFITAFCLHREKVRVLLSVKRFCDSGCVLSVSVELAWLSLGQHPLVLYCSLFDVADSPCCRMRKQRGEGWYNCTLSAVIGLIFVQVVKRDISHID